MTGSMGGCDRPEDDADDELLAALLTSLDDDAADAFGPVQGDDDALGDFPEPLLGSLSDAPPSLIGVDAEHFGGLGVANATGHPDALYDDAPTCSSVLLLSGDAGAGRALVDEPPSTRDLDVKVDSTLAVGTRSAGRAGGSSSKRRKDPNKARNERAREIRGLKGEVVGLTAELKALKTLTTGETDGRLASGESSSAVRGPLSAELMGTPRVWEAICRNQLARRARAERENVRLKRALDEQVKLAHSLERMLKKPSRAMVRRCCVPGSLFMESFSSTLTSLLLSSSSQRSTGDVDLCASKRVYSLPSDSDEDTKIFNLLLAEADAAYFEIDGILALNGLAGSQTEPIRGAQMRDGEHGRFLDMFSSNVLPFSLEATADVVWRFHSGTGKHRGPLYYKTAKVWEPTCSYFLSNVRWR